MIKWKANAYLLIVIFGIVISFEVLVGSYDGTMTYWAWKAAELVIGYAIFCLLDYFKS